jgi:fatty-acid desaturase
MAFIDNVLQVPSYGWKNEKGDLVIPSSKQLFSELFARVNIFKSRKNWIAFVGWFWVLCLMPCFLLACTIYFEWYHILVAAFYSVVVMSVHGTIWYHRYCTHRAFVFKNSFWRFITQNLVVKVIPEEAYVVSHHVHHSKSDLPGDPYNASAGLLYCFLADTNHQGIAKDMDEKDYAKAANFLNHTGVKTNTYAQYQYWGSIAHPVRTLGLWVLNWTFWYTVFYFIGGHGIACTLFAAAMIWVVGVRVFNYTGHGKGVENHVDGIDFDRSNLSINQSRPGIFAGEWHNNHHLFPASARSGFLPNQLDLAWCYIYGLYKIGAVSSYHDSKKQFLQQYINKQPAELQEA